MKQSDHYLHVVKVILKMKTPQGYVSKYGTRLGKKKVGESDANVTDDGDLVIGMTNVSDKKSSPDKPQPLPLKSSKKDLDTTEINQNVVEIKKQLKKDNKHKKTKKVSKKKGSELRNIGNDIVVVTENNPIEKDCEKTVVEEVVTIVGKKEDILLISRRAKRWMIMTMER